MKYEPTWFAGSLFDNCISQPGGGGGGKGGMPPGSATAHAYLYAWVKASFQPVCPSIYLGRG